MEMSQKQKPYLPNEIWLQIANYCDPRDLWLSLRMVNHQLSSCVDQHFLDQVLPGTTIALPITLPTYDIRNPLHGRAILHCWARQGGGGGGGTKEGKDRLLYNLVKLEPAHARVQLLDRWTRMRDDAGGRLDGKVRWDLELGHARIRMPLRQARLERVQDEEGEGAFLSFDWRPTFTRFFESIYPGQVYWSW
ncbi:hypothetical protein KC363_g5734 [Hortaea werneckii]|nr:hypothetical protein KC325_g4819 [Hortaea werneckii]KAI6994165.1 hypothetical protein KC359_g4773 [Hortaea werneckii]KAI7145977.1 hypothetical protein KC344_g4046 [Hortaea werneckii]KAI7174803.1 hypothetical protein KC360_g4069 [Hortaea werneckii]KAI7187921.1 hypothetical protein KC363_g5734 [Hortaea werneckii]